ncbi:MAG: endonuclease/exonuclease/phosphatase family protein, partial [Bacteroidales bacterium]|nr:endonuclease/exonuclease/phosphatase family protein [Bacteroidales bacterium]
MKKYLISLVALLVVALPFKADAQKNRSHVIGFYNLENLFDTYHDDGKNDYEYLPDGANNWTNEKYAKKLRNMAHVIAAMKKDNGVWHTVLGVSEIENRHVLEDLVAEPEIASANFQIVH